MNKIFLILKKRSGEENAESFRLQKRKIGPRACICYSLEQKASWKTCKQYRDHNVTCWYRHSYNQTVNSKKHMECTTSLDAIGLKNKKLFLYREGLLRKIAKKDLSSGEPILQKPFFNGIGMSMNRIIN